MKARTLAANVGKAESRVKRGTPLEKEEIKPRNVPKEREKIKITEQVAKPRKSRKRPAQETQASSKKSKKEDHNISSIIVSKVLPHHLSSEGIVLSMGQGDTGQLGLGPDTSEAGNPSKPSLSENIVQVCAGGMHSLCLTKEGEVFSFGCNDEATLGRPTPEEDDCFSPAKVEGLDSKVIQVVAGDSHSAALDELGRVFTWGTFRDMNGDIGMNNADEDEKEGGGGKDGDFITVIKPTPMLPGVKIVKLASGSSHILCLSEDGVLYSFGACDFGQLGRVSRYNCEKGGRRGISKLLTPGVVRFQRNKGCMDIWAGGYVSYAKTCQDQIFCWGLNNYYQLGFKDMQIRYMPELTPSFDPDLNWKDICIAEHHLLALDANGKLYSMGRGTYGRLGTGEIENDLKELTVVEKMSGVKVVAIGVGSAVSFAVDEDGVLYSWGMGNILQLGNGEEEADVFEPTPFAVNKLSAVKGIMASAGGQHTLLLVQRKEKK